jgi:hypothetical protein
MVFQFDPVIDLARCGGKRQRGGAGANSQFVKKAIMDLVDAVAGQERGGSRPGARGSCQVVLVALGVFPLLPG